MLLTPELTRIYGAGDLIKAKSIRGPASTEIDGIKLTLGIKLTMNLVVSRDLLSEFDFFVEW